MEDHTENKVQYQRRTASLSDWEIVADVIEEIPPGDLSDDEMLAVFSFIRKRNELNSIEEQRAAVGNMLHSLTKAEHPAQDKLAFLRQQIADLYEREWAIVADMRNDVGSAPFRNILQTCITIHKEKERARMQEAVRLYRERLAAETRTHTQPAAPALRSATSHAPTRSSVSDSAPKPIVPAPDRKPQSRSGKQDGGYGCLFSFLGSLLVAAALLIMPLFSSDGEKPAAPKETAPQTVETPPATEPRPILRQQPKPDHGQIFEELTIDGLAPFSVSGTGDIYLVLDPIDLSASAGSGASQSQVSRNEDFMELRVFIRSGMEFETDVPLGEYEVYYATGDAWYGEKELFGPETQYYKCDGIFDFTEDSRGYNGWTLTLTAVYNGNLDTDSIPATVFPK